jgi:hypothetical protein
MREVVLTSPDLPSAAESLIDLANDRGGEDNATVVLGAVGGDLPAPEVGEPVDRTYRMLETFEAPVSVD